MAELTYAEAAREAIAEEMRRDPDVWALGEDLGRGGVFGQYAGLVDEFGPERICDTPISEASIMGASVGAAMVGTRPIVEMRFSDFALCAVDELVNQAAKARYMFGGQARVPMVIREPIGIWRSSAAQHSQSLESWYTHIPGLVVVAPATPADNKGLLKSAIRCDDPVVYMEHKNLWGMTGEVPEDDGWTLPLGAARVEREGGGRHHRDMVAHGAGLRGRRRGARGGGRGSRRRSSICAPSGHGTASAYSLRWRGPGGSSSSTKRLRWADSGPRWPRRWPRSWERRCDASGRPASRSPMLPRSRTGRG